MRAVSVFELVHYLKGVLDYDNNIQNIIVTGEISNFTHHSSGHLYFSLKDDKARISCVMFKGNAAKLLFKPKNGDKVLIIANTSLFESSGSLQLYVSQMKIDGIGDLYQAFEKLKNKLHNEGLFDDIHKKIKPSYPLKIAVLVGDKSAALSDIKTCFKRRWPIAKVDYYPVLVQGEGSVKDIISNLKKVDELNYEAIILARGGGSIEDLWSFNDEELARVIFNLNTFIINGVGHEQDFTIADFVADLRAPTPTASVELITPDIRLVKENINNYKKRFVKAINHQIDNNNDIVESLNNLLIKNVRNNLNYAIQRKDYSLMRLVRFRNSISEIKNKINLTYNELYFILKKQYQDKLQKIINYHGQLNLLIKDRIKDYKTILHRNEILLNAYSYEKTLSRGYTLVSLDNKIISSTNDLKINDSVKIRFKDGDTKMRVEEINNDK